VKKKSMSSRGRGLRSDQGGEKRKKSELRVDITQTTRIVTRGTRRRADQGEESFSSIKGRHQKISG